MSPRRPQRHMATYENPMADGFAHYDVAPSPVSYQDASTASSSSAEPLMKAEYGWPLSTYRRRKSRRQSRDRHEESAPFVAASPPPPPSPVVEHEKHHGAAPAHTHPRMFLCWVVSVPCRRPLCRGDAPHDHRSPREVNLKRVESLSKRAWIHPQQMKHATYGY